MRAARSRSAPERHARVSGAQTAYTTRNTPVESHHVETNWCGDSSVPERELREAGGREDSHTLTKQMEVSINTRAELKTLAPAPARQLQAVHMYLYPQPNFSWYFNCKTCQRRIERARSDSKAQKRAHAPVSTQAPASGPLHSAAGSGCEKPPASPAEANECSIKKVDTGAGAVKPPSWESGISCQHGGTLGPPDPAELRAPEILCFQRCPSEHRLWTVTGAEEKYSGRNDWESGQTRF